MQRLPLPQTLQYRLAQTPESKHGALKYFFSARNIDIFVFLLLEKTAQTRWTCASPLVYLYRPTPRLVGFQLTDLWRVKAVQ